MTDIGAEIIALNRSIAESANDFASLAYAVYDRTMTPAEIAQVVPPLRRLRDISHDGNAKLSEARSSSPQVSALVTEHHHALMVLEAAAAGLLADLEADPVITGSKLERLDVAMTVWADLDVSALRA